MADVYSNFAELASKERNGIDYRIRFEDRETPIVVIAPHGGAIEPGTSEIAEAIACDELSNYVFEGLRERAGELHIASHRFDEPECLKLVTAAPTAIAIHGRKDGGDPETISIGGLDVDLGVAVACALRDAGFAVASAGAGLAAKDPNNVCNRGSSGAGVQLEIPRSLRRKLVNDEAEMRSLADAVRKGLKRRFPRRPKQTPGSG